MHGEPWSGRSSGVANDSMELRERYFFCISLFSPLSSNCDLPRLIALSTKYVLQVGHGILHCARQLHSALPITSGQRYNLIIWMRSSSVRNHMCPMCGQRPSLVAVPFAGEGFTTSDTQQWYCSCLWWFLPCFIIYSMKSHKWAIAFNLIWM